MSASINRLRMLRNFFEKSMKLIKAHPEADSRDSYVAAMWLMFLRDSRT